ncbi:MAG: hypothetical protein V1905_02275 [bacterium]
MQYTSAMNPSILTQLIIKNYKRPPLLYRVAFVGLIIVLFSLFGHFISQVNAMIGESYRLESQQEKIKTLAIDNSYLEVEYSKMNYLFGQADTVKSLMLEKTNHVYYIDTVSEMARK